MFLRTLDANYLCSRDKTATTYPIITCDDSGNLIFFDINGYEYVFEEKIRCFVEIFLLLERQSWRNDKQRDWSIDDSGTIGFMVC